MKVELGLIFVAALFAAAVPASAQQQRQFRLCVPKSKPQECKNLDRAGSGVKCVPVEDSTDCALKLQNRTADFGMFKAEEALLASHFIEGVTVVGDIRHEDRADQDFSFTAVGLARRKRVPGNDLSQVRNLSLCHPGMGLSHTGWSDTVLKEMDLAILKKNGNFRCDDWRSALQNELFSISQHWGASCRPGKWSWSEQTDQYLKSEYKNLCAKCPDVEKCAYSSIGDSNSHKSALSCLKNNGDVAFLDLTEAKRFLETTPNANSEFGYVCRDLTLGSDPTQCNFARQPWSAIVAVKEVAEELGPKLIEWLKPLDTRLSIPDVPERATGGWLRALADLLLEDYHHYISLQPQKMDLKTFVSRGRRLKGTEVPVCDRNLRWCLDKVEEKPKCAWMSTAAWYAGITPAIDCVVALSDKECVHKLAKMEADIVVTNIDHAHYARSTQNLKAARLVETPNDLASSVVAVVKADSPISSLDDLKGKKACFPSYEGIGYGTFLREGLNQSWFKRHSCPYSDSVADFFGDSCMPGASEDELNRPSLCALCDKSLTCGGSPNFTNTDDVEAMQCLKHGGDVTFVKLQDLLESFRKNLLDRVNADEFKVLCKKSASSPDSTIPLGPKAIKCALATVPSHAVLTREGDEVVRDRDASILLYSLDKMFGLSEASVRPEPPFHLYSPFNNNPNFIFPDQASSMMPSDSKDASVIEYQNLIGSIPRPCGGSSSAFSVVAPSVFIVLLSAFLTSDFYSFL